MKGIDCIYQDQLAMRPLIEYLESMCDEGEMVIWRDAFRWKNKEGVLSNHFESASIYALAEEFGYRILANFHHIAVVKRK